MLLKKQKQIMKLNKKTYKKRKAVINTAFKLYGELLNICKTKYKKLYEDLKKRIYVLNKPEMLIIHIEEDDLPPMSPLEDDEEVKLKPEQTIAKEFKKIKK